MKKISFAVKISPEIRERVKEFCQRHGIKQGYFVERALEERLEELENMQDILEFKRWKYQEPKAISFERYLEERNV